MADESVDELDTAELRELLRRDSLAVSNELVSTLVFFPPHIARLPPSPENGRFRRNSIFEGRHFARTFYGEKLKSLRTRDFFRR